MTKSTEYPREIKSVDVAGRVFGPGGQRKRVSRVDSGNTHGYFARVYRAGWVGSRSFADKKYGGKALAEAAAYKWVAVAEERLPTIPPMPVLKKASVHLRSDTKRKNLSYFDVYLPSLNSDSWDTHKLYFKTDEDERRQRTIANNMVANQNFLLADAHKKAMLKWQMNHDRIMQEILSMWDDVHAMPV